MMRPGEGTTVIGRSAKLRGDLSSSEDLQIEGEFDGTVKLTGGRLTIGPEAKVRASIHAPEVVIFGKLEGDIRATGRVDLRSTAVVHGDVFAGRLSMEENAVLRGSVDPSRAGEVAAPAPAATPISAGVVPQAFARPSDSGAFAVPRPSGVYGTQTGSPVHQQRQMPSALAAIAAAGRPESGSGDEDSPEDHHAEAAH